MNASEPEVRRPVEHVALDTSCVVNLLSPKETAKESLLRLVQFATQRRVEITVTQLVDIELPDTGEGESSEHHRQFIRQRLQIFGVDQVPTPRIAERDRLAAEYLGLLWPNAQVDSRAYGHHRRDCEHLASLRITGGGVFVTLDEPLERKASEHRDRIGVEVLLPHEAVERIEPQKVPARRLDQVVREAGPDDGDAISKLMEPIKSSYPDFDGWRRKTLKSEEKRKYVGVIGDRIGGVSMWSKKDDRVIKLSTFYVGDDFQGRGLGPHLVFHQLRLWVEGRFEKVFVTVSSERLDILSFFFGYGFRIEGASSRRYKAGTTEFILAKHLFYERITDDTLGPFLDRLSHEVLSLPNTGSARDPANWFMPPVPSKLRSRWSDTGQLDGAEQVFSDGSTRRIPVNELEELIYPARFALAGREAFLIPIRPEWADSMMEVPRAQGSLFAATDKLRLRTDNAYYCAPRLGPDRLSNSPVLFYVSGADKGIAGVARILNCRIAEPEDLFAEFGSLGVYPLDRVRGHVEKRPNAAHHGRAMALRFAWWVPFKCTIPLDEMRTNFGLSHPQTVTPISYDKYEQLLGAGGIDW